MHGIRALGKCLQRRVRVAMVPTEPVRMKVVISAALGLILWKQQSPVGPRVWNP